MKKGDLVKINKRAYPDLDTCFGIIIECLGEDVVDCGDDQFEFENQEAFNVIVSGRICFFHEYEIEILKGF
jgi:hypothetical protein